MQQAPGQPASHDGASRIVRNAFTRVHSLIATFIMEAILLVGLYLVIDEVIQR